MITLRQNYSSDPSNITINSQISTENSGGWEFIYRRGDICSNDPYSYQACDKDMEGFTVTNDNNTLCGNYLCIMTMSEESRINSLFELHASRWICDGVKDCAQDGRDEAECSRKEISVLPTGQEISSSLVCNDKCEAEECEDEAKCDGLTYGLYCTRKERRKELTIYIPPTSICDGREDCDKGEDEADCNVEGRGKDESADRICKRKIFTDIRKFRTSFAPVHNYTRCFVFDTMFFSYCKTIKLYQTNCTSEDRVGGECLVDGYRSTISKYMICSPDIKYNKHRVCDDHLERLCPRISKSCSVHKHLMCDVTPDCNDKSDETDPICLVKTRSTCRRKIGRRGELALPLVWINDGIEDCVDGEDELDIWPTCGAGTTYRLVTSNDTCQNVFLCLGEEEEGFVELDQLCDGLETCGNENQICSLSRTSSKVSTTVLTTLNGNSKSLSFCLKGLSSLSGLNNNFCSKEDFIFPDHQYFGVDTKTEVTLPGFASQNCDDMFGEQHVYTSCTNKCKNSTCPLKNLPRYEVCPNQYPDRVGTIANNEYLVFFTRSRDDIFSNKYFVCDNKIKCIDYSQVCDLVDDCGDASDEINCTNHFRCNNSKLFVPKSEKCDRKFDCLDMSDECNEQCSKEILETPFLKVSSVLVGCIAVIANTITLLRNTWTLHRCKNSVAMVNKTLVIIISFGDLLVGCYLLVVAIYDTLIFRNKYCLHQIEWVTSNICSTIGVVSTVGAQVSLFAMVGLSLVRLNGARNSVNSLKVPGDITQEKCLKVTLAVIFIILASGTIAVVPIVSAFEDFFVNGVRFSEKLRFFLGTSKKQDILQVIEAYYGRMKETNLSWNTLTSMVRGMFSHDFGYEDHTNKVTNLDFYGNDGVCLFKYFVNRDDPQKFFVWTVLGINFMCFILISISYILISLFTKDSAKSLAKSPASRLINKRNRKMDRKIAVIITTDFICWIPFFFICVSHSIEALNATPWYSLFSMIILPINSVINPVLYDDVVAGIVKTPFRLFTTQLSQCDVFRG